MKLHNLDLFVAVMRSGGFAAAARSRDVDPSSVSRAIAALESDLGVRLIERTTRRFQPTEAGRSYFNDIEPLLAELDNAGVRSRDLLLQPAGTLRITASVAFGSEVLAPLVAPLQQQYPGIDLQLILNDGHVDLVDEQIDLAIRLGPPPGGDWVRSRLMPVRHRVCASPDWLSRHGPLAGPDELQRHACVLFPLPGYRDRWRFRRSDQQPREIGEVAVHGSLSISNALALRRCVVDGLGPGLLADWMIGDALARGQLVDLLPRHEVTASSFDTAAWLLYPSRSYLPRKLRVVADFLRARLGGPD